MKKILAAAAAVFTLAATAATVSADTAGFASESDMVVTAQTPYDKKYVSIDWNTTAGETVGVPLTYEEFLLLPTQNTVQKLAEKDGKVLTAAEFDEKVSENCRGAVIKDTLIQPTRTSIYAVNLDDLSICCSAGFGEIVTDIAADDDLAYFGWRDGESFKFCCADLSNDLETLWEYPSEKPVTSAAKIGGAVVFGAGSDLVVRTEDGFSENPVGAEITHVFAGEYAVFMTCSNGELRKLRLDEDGRAEEESLLICKVGSALTQPAGIDNHIYVGSEDGFFVIDGLNMEIIKCFDDMKNASAPIVTVGSGVRAYTAAPHYDKDGDRWYLYSVLDTEESCTAFELAKIIDFEGGKTTASKSGRMFFRDARGQVWAISGARPGLFVSILKVVLVIAIFVMALLILRAWAKKRQSKMPPEF